MFHPTVHSYFSGAGLMDAGLISGGLPITRSFELDARACKVQRDNLGHHVENVDISRLCVTGQGEADVIIGTYPCTKYSSIADINGARTGDDLFLHFFRHIALMQPEVYVVENVPGMTKFPVVMEAMTQLPDYYVTTFNPVQAEHMVPQRRDHLIIIGSRRPFSWQAPDKHKVPSLMSLLERDPEIVIPHPSTPVSMGSTAINPSSATPSRAISPPPVWPITPKTRVPGWSSTPRPAHPGHTPSGNTPG